MWVVFGDLERWEPDEGELWLRQFSLSGEESQWVNVCSHYESPNIFRLRDYRRREVSASGDGKAA